MPGATIRLSRTTRQELVYDTRFHWSTPLSSRGNRSDRTTESDTSSGPKVCLLYGSALGVDRGDYDTHVATDLLVRTDPCTCTFRSCTNSGGLDETHVATDLLVRTDPCTSTFRNCLCLFSFQSPTSDECRKKATITKHKRARLLLC